MSERGAPGRAPAARPTRSSCEVTDICSQRREPTSEVDLPVRQKFTSERKKDVTNPSGRLPVVPSGGAQGDSGHAEQPIDRQMDHPLGFRAQTRSRLPEGSTLTGHVEKCLQTKMDNPAGPPHPSLCPSLCGHRSCANCFGSVTVLMATPGGVPLLPLSCSVEAPVRCLVLVVGRPTWALDAA